MRLRLGVFATTEGWLVADRERNQRFDDRVEAMRVALQRVSVARWRGQEAEIVAQDLPGGALAVVEPLRR